MSKNINNKSWIIILICNSFAIGVSAIVGIWYAHWKYHMMNNFKTAKRYLLSWYDFVIAGCLSVIAGFLTYGFIYCLSGYLPMG